MYFIKNENDEIIFTGHIPVRCINEYRNTLTLYTNGQAVFLTELKDYQIASGNYGLRLVLSY